MKKIAKLGAHYIIIIATIVLGSLLYKLAKENAQQTYNGIGMLLTVRTVIYVCVFVLVLMRTSFCVLHPDKTCVPIYVLCSVVTSMFLIAQHCMFLFSPQLHTDMLLLLVAVSDIFNAVVMRCIGFASR